MWRPFYGSKWDGCALLLRHIQAAWEMCYRPPVELTMPIHMFRKGQIEGIAKGNILTHNQFINQLFGVAASRALTTLFSHSHQYLQCNPRPPVGSSAPFKEPTRVFHRDLVDVAV
jgi:hypothetical protein